MVQPQNGGPQPWLKCDACGGHNPSRNGHCGDCGGAKSARWLVAPPRGERNGKGKAKGKSKGENEYVGKGKGKGPSMRTPQPAKLGDWVQAAKRAVGKSAGRDSAHVGAAKTSTETRQAAEIAALRRQLAEAGKATVDTAPATVDAPAEEAAQPDWECGYCGSGHRNHKATVCRNCTKSRVAASAPTALGLSPLEVETERARLLATKQSLVAAAGASNPALLAAVTKDLEDRLRLLDAPPVAGTPYDVLNQARLVVSKAEAYLNKLIEKGKFIEDRMQEVQKDAEALDRAATQAQQEYDQAQAALEVATAALPRVADAAMPAAQVDSSAQHAQDGIVQAVMLRAMEALTEELNAAMSPGSDRDSLLKSLLQKLGRCHHPAAVPPTTSPQAARPPSGAPGTPVAGALQADGGDGRLPLRVAPKTADVEGTSAAAQRKQQEAIRQRNLRREADLEARRTNGEGAEGNEEEELPLCR